MNVAARPARGFNLYRVAAVLLVLFDVGHTLGGVLFHKTSGPAEENVLAVMRETRITIGGGEVTYYGFHLGYGLMTSVFLAFSAYLAWLLGKPDSPDAMRPIGWALFASQACFAVLAWRYFFPMPGVFATAIALALGARCFLGPSAASRGSRSS